MKDFSAVEWATLSIAERIELCRVAARQAEADAKTADPPSMQAYTNLAMQWRLLATEIERTHGSSEKTSGSVSD